MKKATKKAARRQCVECARTRQAAEELAESLHQQGERIRAIACEIRALLCPISIDMPVGEQVRRQIDAMTLAVEVMDEGTMLAESAEKLEVRR